MSALPQMKTKPYLTYHPYPASPKPRNKYVIRITVASGPHADEFVKTTKLTVDEFDLIIDLINEIHNLPKPKVIEHSVPCKMPFSKWMSSFCALQEIGSVVINGMIDTLVKCLPTTSSPITPHGYVVNDIMIKYYDDDSREYGVNFKSDLVTNG